MKGKYDMNELPLSMGSESNNMAYKTNECAEAINQVKTLH